MEPNSEIPWMDETEEWGSAVTVEETSAAVLVAVIIGVIAAVILLFSLALLIDCRHQKMGDPTKSIPVKRTLVLKRLRFPIFIRNSARNNENLTIANEMCTENKNTSPPLSGGVEPC